jgi:hypothetical protein
MVTGSDWDPDDSKPMGGLRSDPYLLDTGNKLTSEVAKCQTAPHAGGELEAAVTQGNKPWRIWGCGCPGDCAQGRS